MGVVELLKESSLFRNLGPGEIELIARSTRLETYKAGQAIVREGHVGAAFFIIVSGRVEVVKGLSSPTPVIVETFGAGDFFGEISTFRHLPRSASVRALQETTCLVIWRTDFDAFFSKFPEAAAEVEAALRARLTGGENPED